MISKDSTTKIAIFQKKEIRKTIYKDEWWFSIIDVIETLTDTERPRKYWSDLKKRLIKEGFFEVSEKIGQLKLKAPDGKMRTTDVAETESLLRLIQSIPSPKAEPFKLWLAKVGYERIEETEDPELSIDRAMQTYLKEINKTNPFLKFGSNRIENTLRQLVLNAIFSISFISKPLA